MLLLVYFLFVIIYGGANGYASLFDPTNFIGLIHILFLVTILGALLFLCREPTEEEKNVTRRFRNRENVSRKPTRGPETMRTIRHGKAGVTSITTGKETNKEENPIMSTKFILSCSFDNGVFEEFDTEQEFFKAIQQLIKESKSDVFVLDYAPFFDLESD